VTRRRWPWLVLALLVAAAALAAYRMRPVEVPAVQLKRAALQRTLQFSARVATTSRVNVGSTLTGRVATVHVREGDAVQQGQTLLQLETDELRTALAQAQASARQAQARVAGLRASGRMVARAQSEQAAATLRAAERELARTQQLIAQGFISQARLDDARRAVEVARAQQASAQAQVQAVAESGADLAQAQAQQAQSLAAVEAGQARLAQTTVRAPTDGRVLLRSVEPGQIVQPGAALLSLALAGPTQLVAQVDERFLDQLQVGQPASVVADAFATQPFAARVLSIAPAVDAQRGAIEVKLAPEQTPPAFLREDMTLSVEVLTGERASALVLPLSALQGDGAVWVLADGRVQARPVRLGLRTLDAAEVLEGLTEGEQVLVGATAKPGQRARARVLPWQSAVKHWRGTQDDAASSVMNTMGR